MGTIVLGGGSIDPAGFWPGALVESFLPVLCPYALPPCWPPAPSVRFSVSGLTVLAYWAAAGRKGRQHNLGGSFPVKNKEKTSYDWR